MSNNVVSFSRKQSKPMPKATPNTTANLIGAITDWAEEQGVDVYNDVGFQIRCADFIMHLQIMASGERKTA